MSGGEASTFGDTLRELSVSAGYDKLVFTVNRLLDAVDEPAAQGLWETLVGPFQGPWYADEGNQKLVGLHLSDQDLYLVDVVEDPATPGALLFVVAWHDEVEWRKKMDKRRRRQKARGARRPRDPQDPVYQEFVARRQRYEEKKRRLRATPEYAEFLKSKSRHEERKARIQSSALYQEFLDKKARHELRRRQKLMDQELLAHMSSRRNFERRTATDRQPALPPTPLQPPRGATFVKPAPLKVKRFITGERGSYVKDAEPQAIKIVDTTLKRHKERKAGPLLDPGVEPIAVDLSDGEKYICRCGHSLNYPFCDGSHVSFNAQNDTNFSPWKADAQEQGKDTIYVCGCGSSKKRNEEGVPLCDGSHIKLPDGEKEARLLARSQRAESADASSRKIDAAKSQVDKAKAEAEAAAKAKKEAFLAKEQALEEDFRERAAKNNAEAVAVDSDASVGPLLEPGTGPHKVNLSEGPRYICRCGASSFYPFCDGSHSAVNEERGTSFSPWVADPEELKQDTIYVCGCGESKKRRDEGIPLCDGSHEALEVNRKKAAADAALSSAKQAQEEAKTKISEAEEQVKQAEIQAKVDAARSIPKGPLSGELKKPGTEPIAVDLSDGEKYICRCGQSNTFPLCDGTHVTYNDSEGTNFSPYMASADELGKDTIYVCACGQSAKRDEGLPFCDGSHMSLQQSVENIDSKAAAEAFTAAYERSLAALHNRDWGTQASEMEAFRDIIEKEELETTDAVTSAFEALEATGDTDAINVAALQLSDLKGSAKDRRKAFESALMWQKKSEAKAARAQEEKLAAIKKAQEEEEAAAAAAKKAEEEEEAAAAAAAAKKAEEEKEAAAAAAAAKKAEEEKEAAAAAAAAKKAEEEKEAAATAAAAKKAEEEKEAAAAAAAAKKAEEEKEAAAAAAQKEKEEKEAKKRAEEEAAIAAAQDKREKAEHAAVTAAVAATSHEETDEKKLIKQAKGLIGTGANKTWQEYVSEGTPVIRRFMDLAAQRADEPAYKFKQDETWTSVSWSQYAMQVQTAAKAITALGVRPQQNVMLVADTRPEWAVIALGTQMCGATLVSAPATFTAEQLTEVVQEAKPVLLVMDSQEVWSKLRDAAPTFDTVRHYLCVQATVDSPRALPWSTFLKKSVMTRSTALLQRYNDIKSEHVATLSYTDRSETGVQGSSLTHGNETYASDKVVALVSMTEKDRLLAFMPFAGSAERSVSLYGALTVGSLVYYGDELDQLHANLTAVQPTLLYSAPVLLERFESVIRAKLGKKDPSTLASKVRKKLRKFIGAMRVRVCLSGTASIAASTQTFYKALGISIHDVFTKSSASGIVLVDGKPLEGTEATVISGELLIKGPGVSRARADAAGFLHTGEAASLSEDGRVTIKGPLSSVFSLASGKKIYAEIVESKLRRSPLVSGAMVVGEGRPFVVALVALERNAVRSAAEKEGKTVEQIATDPSTMKSIDADITAVNKELKEHERIQKWKLLPREFSVAQGEVTPSMLLKRTAISNKYQDMINSMF